MNAGQTIRRLAVFFMSQTQKENGRLPGKQPYGNEYNPWLSWICPLASVYWAHLIYGEPY